MRSLLQHTFMLPSNTTPAAMRFTYKKIAGWQQLAVFGRAATLLMQAAQVCSGVRCGATVGWCGVRVLVACKGVGGSAASTAYSSLL